MIKFRANSNGQEIKMERIPYLCCLVFEIIKVGISEAAR